MYKKIEKDEKGYFINFTEEECKELGIAPGNVFNIQADFGVVTLTKAETLELDLSTLDRETLIGLIQFMHEKELTFNQAIEVILKDVVERLEAQEELKPSDYSPDQERQSVFGARAKTAEEFKNLFVEFCRHHGYVITARNNENFDEPNLWVNLFVSKLSLLESGEANYFFANRISHK